MNQHPLKFFERYSITPRSHQVEVVNELHEKWSKYKYFLLSLPTGVGKTYVATAIADSIQRAYLLTSTLQLQEQYEASWDEIVNIKGRGNYKCNVNPAFTVDAAPCSVDKGLIADCKKNSICAYYNQKKAALASHAMITNPLFMLYSTHCGMLQEEDEGGSTDWVQREALIIDEAHNLEGHLVQFAESDVNPQKYYDDFGVMVQHVKFTGKPDQDYALVCEVYEKLKSKAVELQAKLEEEFPRQTAFSGREWARGIEGKVAEKVRKMQAKIYALDKVIQPLKIFFNTHESAEELAQRWLLVADLEKNVLKLAPIYADFLFHYYLGDLAQKFVFMSATPGNKEAFCRELGIKPEECLYIETGSPFPPDQSPVIINPVITLSYDKYAENIPKLGGQIDRILDIHRHERGIIHATTYQLQTDIFNRVSKKHQARLLCRDMDVLSGKPVPKGQWPKKYKNSELLEIHEREGAARCSVLLSPSMMEGVDLKDDLSKFQVIVRLPWANLGDARVKAKSKLDDDWYANRMWMHILQASGRSTRHEADYSVTYILDAKFKYFYEQWKRKLPGWFKERLVF